MLSRIALLCLTQTPSLICPPGTRLERTLTAEKNWTRWCALPDGGMTGPWDEWSVGGRRLSSNLDDPSRLAPFRDPGAVRNEPFELRGHDPR